MTNSAWPRWTTEIMKKTVRGEDQLGLESAAQNYQQEIVPGITTVTNHTRYYSFYAWVLYRYIFHDHSSRYLKDFRGDYFKRFEVALIIANYAHHKEGELMTQVVGTGNNSKNPREYWASGVDISLKQKYFQNTLGGFGQYYLTPMRAMGIVADPEAPRFVYRLTDRGEKLAIAYEDSIKHTQYFQRLQDQFQLETISREEAIELGESGCLCHQSLSRGEDREILLDTFFRLDEATTLDNPHARRRNSFGVALDLITHGRGQFNSDILRPALYLGQYNADTKYTPSPEIMEWAKRWQMVEVRHIYSFALQCLWGAFILELEEKLAIKREDWFAWIKEKLDQFNWDLAYKALSEALCKQAGQDKDFASLLDTRPAEFDLDFDLNEYSLYQTARNHNEDSLALFQCGVQLLIFFYLRFFTDYQEEDPVWQEMAGRQRLPINDYFSQMSEALAVPGFSTFEWLKWVYQTYIWEQHEMMALNKLRYQNYDTFKFYYEAGTFHWPMGKGNFHVPIGLTSNRLFNCLTMLIDFGLVIENDDATLTLSDEGVQLHADILRRLHDAD
jgi:hypothetical protein